eukprot:TRINITY_DN23314_c0_g1_i17.p1 TRINITY_DN23314_c0_g1~~TRINITY_DN23314_c0_g1_i17.p1  ORF type:complete len:487 (+),score=120.46 TRINITY_DN23314_c0_g1_i17:83-1543(+)
MIRRPPRSTLSSSSAASDVYKRQEQDQEPPEVAIPDEFRCSITQELFECPVITSDGHSYEAAAIRRWLESHSTSPLTGQHLPDKVIRPNHSLRAQVVEFREKHALPPLEPWAPEPQEEVQQSSEANAAPLDGVVQIQLPSGHVRQVSGASMVQALTNLLQSTPELLQMLRAHGVPTGDLSSMVGHILQHPLLLNTVMAHGNARQHVLPLLMAPAPAEPELPLFQATRQGELSVVERLLGDMSGVQLSDHKNPAGDSLLHIASWEGHHRLVTMLLARGHDLHALSVNRSTPLHYAAWQGRLATVELLLDSNAEIERHMQGGDTALHQAVWQGHTEVVALLLNRCADVDAIKDDGTTSVHLACQRQQLEALKLLIERGGRVDQQNSQRLQPIHQAAVTGNTEIGKLLMAAKASPEARLNMEEGPIHIAAANGRSEMIKLLCDSGINKDARREDGCTALCMAVIAGQTASLEVLMGRARVRDRVSVRLG